MQNKWHHIKNKLVNYWQHEPPDHYLGYVVEGKPPVIILAGITHTWRMLRKFGDLISLKGYPVYIVPSLGHNFTDIAKSARLVGEVIDKNNLTNIIIVGHSKGGLIGKYLLLDEKYDNAIKVIIAIATPFAGGKLAKLVPHKSYRELSPNSKLLKKLQENNSANSKIVSIFPQFDPLIWSKESSYLEGAKNIELDKKGHDAIITDLDAIQEVIKQIESS